MTTSKDLELLGSAFKASYKHQRAQHAPPRRPMTLERGHNELRFNTRVDRIQGRLWDMAVTNARKDMNSDVAALYIESLNEIFEVHALRLAFGLQVRIPMGIWVVLYGLTILGMMVMGYHTGIAGSKRSMAALILALSFAVVIAMIVSLDRPGGFIKVAQQPLIDLQGSITGREQIPKDTTQE